METFARVLFSSLISTTDTFVAFVVLAGDGGKKRREKNHERDETSARKVLSNVLLAYK